MPKYVVESLGSGKEEIEAHAVQISEDWIIFYSGVTSSTNVLAAFPTAQVFRVIPG